MYERFYNRLYTFLLILISSNCYQESVGDSGLPKDSNTVVGKPQLGEKKRNLLRVSGSVYSGSPGRLLFTCTCRVLFLERKVFRSSYVWNEKIRGEREQSPKGYSRGKNDGENP